MNGVLKVLLFVFICGLITFASENKGMSSIDFQVTDVTTSSDFVLDADGLENDFSLLLPVPYNFSTAARQYHNIQRLRLLRAKNLLRHVIRYTKYQIIKTKYVFLNSFIRDFLNLLVLKSIFHNPNYILVAKRVLII